MPREESTDQVYQLDDLRADYEGLWVPECPECGDSFVLEKMGECPICGAEYDVEVRFDAE